MEVGLTSLFNLLVCHFRLTYFPLINVDIMLFAVLAPLGCILDLRLAHICALKDEVVEGNARKRDDLFVAVFGP